MDKLMSEKPRKVRERQTKKGYWYKCPICDCGHGDFEESQVGKIAKCGLCERKLEIVK